MNVKPILELIPSDYYQKIHDASVKILKEKGVIFFSNDALEIFKKHGAKVEGNTVYYTDEIINNAIKNFKPTFTWKARDPQKTKVVGEDVLMMRTGGAVFIQDMDKNRRRGTYQDFLNLQKIYNASDAIDIPGLFPIDTCDLPKDKKLIHMMAGAIKSTKKPITGFAERASIVEKTLDMMELIVGEEEFKSNVYVGASCNPRTPLEWSEESTDTIIAYAKRNQQVQIFVCTMPGVTAPLSLLGAAILQNTEILSGLILAKLVNPETPVVYGSGSAISNMKTLTCAFGSPEYMFNIITVQMGRDFYHLPTRMGGAMVESKSPDYQAGLESMQCMMLNVLSGANLVCSPTGMVDTGMTISYEKVMMDLEIIDRVRCIRNGLSEFDSTISTDAIMRVPHGGSFVEDIDTLLNFRTRWQPSISDWGTYEAWVENGQQDLLPTANKKWQEVLEAAPDTVLETDEQKALDNFLAKALND